MAKEPVTPWEIGGQGGRGRQQLLYLGAWDLGGLCQQLWQVWSGDSAQGLGNGVQTSGTFQKQKMRDQHGLLTFQFYRLGHYKNKEKKEKRKLTFTTISQMQGYFDPLPFSRKDIMSK